MDGSNQGVDSVPFETNFVESSQYNCDHEREECTSSNTEISDEVRHAELTEGVEIPVENDASHENSVSDVSESPLNPAVTESDVATQCEDMQNNLLSQKIVTQVEYYFSDENLVKDSFLMQRINRDKRGYVDLKLISSFKKMKKLTRDVDVVAAALQTSKKLEVNKTGTMVRRVAPLPMTKEEAAALKTVVAVNFVDSGNLAERFGSCGTVTRVRVVQKNDVVPSDVRKHVRRSLDDGGRAATAIAFIEYDDNKSAQSACESLTDSSDWRHGLHVSMLVARQPEKRASSNKVSPVKECNIGDANRLSESVENEVQSLQIKKKSNKKNRSRVEAILHDEFAVYSSSGSETEGQEEPKEHRVSVSRSKPTGSRPSKGGSGRSSAFAQSILAHNNVSLANDLHGEVRARSGSTGTIELTSHGISPWVQRRLQAAQRESKSAGGSLTDLSAGDTIPVTKSADVISVLRQPKGPDGTRGFNLER